MIDAQQEATRQEIFANDRRHVWHALAPHHEGEPWVVESARGVRITDMDGKQYLDAMAGLWCVNAGYGQERLARAAYDQMVRMPYYPLSASHIPAAQLAGRLSEWLGGDYRLFFGNGGSEANETAFKIARQYHIQNGQPLRHKVIARYRAYHGATAAALAATGQNQRKYAYEPLPQGFLHISPPDMYRGRGSEDELSYAKRCADELERVILWEGEETVSAFIMEPIITGGGVLVPPADYLDRVADVCRRHGVLLIVDEVICGFGRTGKRFGFQHNDVLPDIVTMAKGITSGYAPLSATAVRGELYDAFADASDPRAHFRHVNTFGGHPVSCAVALENLALFEEQDLVARAAELGALLHRELQALYEFEEVGDVRGRGLLAGVELVADRRDMRPLPAAALRAIVGHCKARGLIVGRNGDTVADLNNVLALAPPLVVEERDIRWIVQVLRDSIGQYVQESARG